MSGAATSKPKRPGEHQRYPGPRSFSDNRIDQRLFFGREQEIDHLLHRIQAVRLLVLFGKSGLGKTSLLQAGLYPRLRERGLLPIPVRLNQPNLAPVQAVFEALRATCNAYGVEYNPGDTEGLWEFFKATDFWHADVLQTPVLVFDQFEEIFTLHSDGVRTTLSSQLGELAARGVPARIRQRLRAGERHNDTPPDVKVILSLREEYVGALEDLAPNVPGIFEQRFRLAPLNRELARRAVVEPAAMVDAAIFKTPPFRYSDGALDAIMDFLANRQGDVEPFQLQILCRHAEQQVALRQLEDASDAQVDEALLGGRKVMEALLESFYQDALWVLPSSRQRSRARDLCEYGLLSPSGHRISVEQGQIKDKYKLNDPDLDALTLTRLIRKDTRPGLDGFYYELSHDSVARAVNRSRRFRVSKTVKATVGAVCFLAVIVSYWFYAQFAMEQRTTQVTASVSRSNTLALLVRGGLNQPLMVEIPTGVFRMGDIHGGGDKDERPVRPVTIERRISLSRYEITFEEYDQFASATGRRLPDDSSWGRGRRPVINVSWQDARDYAAWLSVQTGKRYRLPTEAEWEYAARGGEKHLLWPGTDNEKELGEYAWYIANSGYRTQEVGSKRPNAFGLHDMSGNVFEWVEDCWHGNYNGAPTDGSAWLEAGGGQCGRRVFRGGSWNDGPGDLRASSRNWINADVRHYVIGFRLAQDID